MEITVDKYEQAQVKFNLREYNSAELILQELLNENPHDFDVLNFLGIIKLNKKNYTEAIQFFNRVLKIRPDHPYALYNLGFCHQQLENYESAKFAYLKSIELKDDIVDAFINLGLVCSKLKNYEEAESYYLKALSILPNNADVYNNLGNLFLFKDKPEDAVEYYKSAIKLNSEKYDYHFNLGNAYKKLHKYDLALASYEKAIAICPSFHEAYNNMGNVYLDFRDYNNAEKCFEKVLEFSENDVEANFNLGKCFKESKNYDKSLNQFKKYLELQPDEPGALLSIAEVYNELGEENKYKKYVETVTDGEFSKLAVLTNLGVSKLEQNELEKGVKYFYEALKIDNDHPEIHYNLAHALLLLGKFREGWNEYEWRLKRKEFIKRKLSKPLLKNIEDVNGKKIFVYDEQGLGDSIQFSRYLKLLKQENCKLIFECDPRLYNLYQNHNIADVLIARKNLEEDPELDYDLQIPLLSLPKLFQTEIDAIPNDVPYLKIEKKNEKISGTFKDNDNLKVGLAWAGNPNHTGDKKRSCPLKNFNPLFTLQNIDFYSLQKGEAVKQLKETPNNIINLDSYLNDFTDTAEYINELDLIISVDTSVAHLAGAMGKEVWLLLPLVPDWRWLTERTTTPWYSSMKLFRQKYSNNWDTVITEISIELQKKLRINSDTVTQNLDSRDSAAHENRKLFLGLAKGENFGWGVCSKYLHSELSKLLEVHDLNDRDSDTNINSEKTFLALTNVDLAPMHELTGKENYGYTFFENELNDSSYSNSKKLTKVIAGSSWCKQKLEDKGIMNTGLLLQGIDPELFYPGDTKKTNDLFVIFSGGKFELRKGQDLVLKAIKILQDKYKDIILINAWYNFWPATMHPMASSPYINFQLKGNDWHDFMLNLYSINNLDSSRIFTLPVVPNSKMRDLYLKTDLGLFPNRCEGGTNLVLMEYMACGKPVVGSFNTGHRDILTKENSLLLEKMKPYKLFDDNKNLFTDWEEPDLDETISKIEFAYHNRDEIKSIGNSAAEDMKQFTWKNTAENLVKIIFEGCRDV